MSKSRSNAQFVFRPAVAIAGLCVLGVIILSALHEVSAPSVVAREALTAPTVEARPEALGAPGLEEETVAAADKEPASFQVAEAQPASPAASEADAPRFGDIVMGDPDAPVTVIEYSSMTCSHCARFHTDTLPALKEQYVDTGKVKFIMREFPLDNLAGAASMLARCVSQDKFYPFLDMLFETQAQWARAQDPVQELRQITRIAGFTEERFNQCLTDQEALEYVQQVRDEGDRKYDIRSTPTFIINGQKLQGAQPIERFQAVIDPLLDEAGKS